MNEDAVKEVRKRLRTFENYSELEKTEYGTDNTLRRFLIANEGNIKEAADKLSSSFDWRSNIAKRQDMKDLQARMQKTQEAFLHGRDKEGHPCAYFIMRNHFPETWDSDEYIAAGVYMLEIAVAALEEAVDKDKKSCITVIADFKGFGWSNIDYKIMKSASNILAEHFPERCGKIYMVNTSWIFRSLYLIVKNLRIFPKDILESFIVLGYSFLKEMEDVIEILPRAIYCAEREEEEDGYTGEIQYCPWSCCPEPNLAMKVPQSEVSEAMICSVKPRDGGRKGHAGCICCGTKTGEVSKDPR